MYADLSSSGAREGNDALKGALLRIEQVNASGGLGGRRIELVTRDMKQNPTEAVKAYTQLVQEEGVCAVIGSVVPNSGLAVSPVADLSKVPLVSLSLDDRVTNPDLKPESPDAAGSVRQFVFLLQPSAIQSAVSFAGYAAERFAMRRYAAIYDPVNPLSVMQAHAFENAIAKSGRIVAASVPLPEAGLPSPPAVLMDAQADAVYICAGLEKNVAAAAVIHAALPNAVLLGNQAWYIPSDATKSAFGDASKFAFGDAGNGAWFCMPVSPDDPGLAEIASAFSARFGERPRPAVVPGWDAAGLILAAVRKAGTSNPLKLRDTLEQMAGYKALQGAFDMDRKTHRPLFLPVAIMRIVNGANVTVEARYLFKPPKPAKSP
jgi:branched-chain amino acid transport system substrate-binding protein